MSVFDNHLNEDQLRSDADKMILENYRISNSGHTLIPKEGRFALTKDQKKHLWQPGRTDKLPTRTFREEKSVFSSMYGKLNHYEYSKLYPKFQNIIRGMGLPCLVYNKKRYYQVNRDVKRQIAAKIHSELNI